MPRIARNTFWLFLSRLTAQGLSFVLSVAIARLLGAAALGQYSFILALAFVGNVLSTFGLDTLLIRALARRDETSAQLLGAALRAQLLLAAGYGLVVFLVIGLLSADAATVALSRLYLLALAPLALATVGSAALRARERMDLYFVAGAGAALLQNGGGLLLLWRGVALDGLIVFLLLAQLPAALLSLWLARRAEPLFSLRSGQITVATIVRRSAPLALLGIVAVAYQRLGVLLLTPLAGEEAAGHFSAALRLAEVLKVVPYALYGALFPGLARQAATTATAPALRRWLWLLGGGTAGAALLLSVAAEPLTALLYGEGYEPAAAALRLLAWLPLPFLLALHDSLRLVAAGEERAALRASLQALLLALPLFTAGVLLADSSGAAAAALLSELAHAALLRRQRRRPSAVAQVSRD